MANAVSKEQWLTGPVEGVPALLQPVAHALLQAVVEVEQLMINFPDELLWEKPAGVASPGFHLQHLAGVLDRLFTYASGGTLSREQLDALNAEGQPTTVDPQMLVSAFKTKVHHCIEFLKSTNEASLAESRKVGRAGLPSTVIGLLIHAAEHTMRHLGQLLVTVKIIKQQRLAKWRSSDDRL